jgi:hypothetical protein
MTSTLFGSAPKATFSTQPTISPAQQPILDTLSSILSNAFPYQQGGFGLGSTSLAALENQAMNVGAAPTGAQTGINTASTDALTKALGFTAPNVTAGTVTPTSVTGTNVNAPQIDSTAAFTKGVVEPLTDDFLKRTLPSIAGQFGGSAGGAYGSGSKNARENAATDLERTLAEKGSEFAYSAAAANQNATLNALLANQRTGLAAGLANQATDLSAATANQGAGLTAGVSNQSASINAIKDILAAIGLAPTTATLPQTELGANIGLSTATFSPYQQMIADLIAGGTGQTQQTSGVGSGGSTGLLGGIFSGIGALGSAPAGGTSALANIATWFSDRRIKEDIEEVGSVDGFPLYRFRYKGTPERHVGVMAQDVEKRVPRAVREIGGVKIVDYGAIIEGVLKEAA